MHEGKLVFAPVMAHLPLSTFRRCVARYDGEPPVLRPASFETTRRRWLDAACNNGEVQARREAARSLVGNQASTAESSAFGESDFREAQVKLAATVPIPPVWCHHFQNLHARRRRMAQHCRAVCAPRFDADALQIAKRLHPRQHLTVALACGGEAAAARHLVALINDRGDMQVLVSKRRSSVSVDRRRERTARVARNLHSAQHFKRILTIR